MKFTKDQKPPEPRLYLAAGESLALIQDWLERYERYRLDVGEFAAEVGADPKRWYHDSNLKAIALIFDGKPPKGWVKGSHGCGHRPNAKRKDMAPARARMHGDWEHSPRGDITKALLGSTPKYLVLLSVGDNRVRGYGYNIGWEKVGEDWIIKVDGLDEIPAPPDAKLLKKSEFWALKEAAEDAQRETAR